MRGQAAAEDAELRSVMGRRHRAHTADSVQHRSAATFASSFWRSVISTSSMRRSFCADKPGALNFPSLE